ncbi:MAG: carbon monoxide dehydrogenase subunit G [Meiothermus sp.]|uniref:SRPBCC family protein n=1 Tax=Meiothermus sp. TaxID=1955249 RepID=UPI002631B0AC|nr:carbon monoxide dehydrogenase subunit G [Meiothermus sp.]MCS7059100.1 carbon monoxide dehydrogenase subunit G [Meiothermus sp.]MCX7741314.1 carbon monoxide dehydrogenase subunit G [Meiothermus sp.]MDW8481043.1 carbon monoxide dehydrogenase subunit G [Meiothermus sp.]
MKLEYSGQERVQAEADKVWRFIQDPQKVASCLPDLKSVEIKDEKNMVATVGVAVGPVRGTFRFNIELDPRPEENKVMVRLRGGGLGSAVDLTASASITDQGDQTTLLDWQGQATVSGPAASLGGRVLDAQAKKLIQTVFANLSQRMSEA